MYYPEAQNEFAEFLKECAARVDSYFWKLSGKDANSLCRFLCMEEQDLMAILRLCRVFYGAKDHFSKNNFELLMTRCGFDWTTFKVDGKAERFVKIGHGDVVLPKNMYSSDGNLQVYPTEEKHKIRLRTKEQKSPLNKLLNSAAEEVKNNSGFSGSPAYKGTPNKSVSSRKDLSPKALFMAYVQELLDLSPKVGDSKMSARSMRKLQRLFLATVDACAKELVHEALLKYSVDKLVEAEQQVGRSPDGVYSTTISDVRSLKTQA